MNEKNNKGFVRFFVDRPMIIRVFLVMVFLSGFIAMLSMNRNQFPDVDTKRLSISTHYPGASPEDVELKVTKVIEDSIKGIAGIKRFVSDSATGSSIINVEIEMDYDKSEKTKRDIHDYVQLAEAALPTGASKPSIIELDPTVIVVASYIITSDNLSEMQLRDAAIEAENLIRAIPGIKDVSKVGFRNKEYQAFANIGKMNRLQVTLSDINTAIANYNVRSGGGSVDELNKTRNIVTESLFKNIENVGNVTIRENFQGENVKIKDIADINNGFTPRTLYTRAERTNGILLQITKVASADVIKTVDHIDKVVKDLIPHLQDDMGGQINFIKCYDLTVDIKNMLSITTENAYEGFILVFIILLIFLDGRTAFWAAFNIPVSILMTFVVIHIYFGFGFDMLTLFGMITVLGIVVDQGIVVAENIYQKIEQGLSPKEATIMGTNEIARAVIAAVAVTIMAFAPLLFLGDIVGAFIRSLPIVVIISLLCSTVEVFVSLPTHIMESAEKKLAKLKKKGKSMSMDTENSLGWFSIGYKGCLRFVLKWRYLTVIVFFLVLQSSCKIGGKLPFIFFSDEQGTVLQMSFETSRGNNLDQTLSAVKYVENKVLEEIQYGKELRNITSQVGVRKDDPLHPVAPEAYTAYIQVLLTPFEERSRNIVTITNAVRDRLSKDPYIKGHFTKMVINPQASGPPSEADFYWRFSSNDDTLLEMASRKLEKYVSSLKGAYGIENTLDRVQDQIGIYFKYDQMYRLGVNPNTVSSTVQTAYSGTVQPNYIPDINDPTYIRVSLLEKYQRSQDQLKRLLIPATRRQVSLSQVAVIKNEVSLVSYSHLNARRSVGIYGYVDKAVTDSLIVDAAIEKFIHANFDSTPNLWVMKTGQGEEMGNAFSGAAKAAIVGLVGIFLILVLTLNSVWQSIFLMMVIPFSLIGVFYGFFFHSEALGFFSIIGILGLAGVVVNHAVVLVDIVNVRMKEQHIDYHIIKSYQDFLINACETRLRPIILTTLCTVVGLVPAIYGLGGSNDFIKPLGMALGDGLLVGMVVTLLLIPCFYHIDRDIKQLFTKIKGLLSSSKSK
jgi:multidrug efflux pump subunit AcrB